MLIFTENKVLSSHLLPLINQNKTIGFIPTMGALHKGHLSLIEKSLIENDITVMSIFVNPTQFNNKEDLEKYPRTLEADVAKIKKISSEVIIYNPTVKDIYENNVESQDFSYDGLEFQMEGKHRVGHFNGVGTIVKRLFEIIKPTNAYFGEKDFQQLQIVKKMVSKHNLPVTIIGCPIYREKSGLAMSSRNERLSDESREKASVIYEILKETKKLFQKKSANEVVKIVEEKFKKMPDFKLEYFEIAEESTLLTCKRKNKTKKYRGFIAVFIDNIRLIDNISM
ncbi:pantoate--beta-alanine ligase [Flavobacterium sediminilitoris]|uniref:Pantothenate synthetase n=1 Tax=Flavobacterium sediminilitoris TaxID=2024526 RepID=A0ABY4HR28_9FLAO|nr:MULTISPECIES: pantoate--beta-alanine ligase [Flavobacterium]UOX35140.1 pantoate--beta-alanine ligase [Flavobacterium sediminilitoris]